MEVCMVYNSVCRKGQNRQTCAESCSSQEGIVGRVVSREAANGYGTSSLGEWEAV